MALSTLKAISASGSGLTDGKSFFWQANSLPVGVETVVLTLPISTGTGFTIFSTMFSGRGDARFRLKVDGDEIDSGQIVWTHRVDRGIYPGGIFVANGKSITITVKSLAEEVCDFFGSIQGIDVA